MQIPVLKAVAMPPKVFWAPMFPVVINFVLQMSVMILLQGAFPGQINPLVFIWSFCIVHVILIYWGAKEPHLSGILKMWGKVRPYWAKDGELKADYGLIATAVDSNAIQFKGGIKVCVIRLNKTGFSETDWERWLIDLGHYGVSAKVRVNAFRENYIILSLGRGVFDSRLPEAARATALILKDWQPELLSAGEAKRILEEPLLDAVRYDNKKQVLVLGNQKRYMTSIGLQALGDQMNTQMIQDILNLRKDIIIEHGIKVVPTVKANALLMQQRKMAFFTTFSQNVYDQYTGALEAIDTLREFPQALLEYSLTIFVSAESLDNLNRAVQEIKDIYDRYLFRSVQEKRTIRESFITLFPVCQSYSRTFLCLSNVVGAALYVGPENKMRQNSWGAMF